MSTERYSIYVFKSYVLKEHSELIKRVNRARLRTFAENNYRNNGVISNVLKNSDYNENIFQLQTECLENGLHKEYYECLKINRANYERVKRLKERIGTMLSNGPCIFITLTFNDDTLNLLSSKERRVAVSRYLKLFNCPYVANIDFGKDNHREHYHALVQTTAINFDRWRKYGNINAERVRLKQQNEDKVKLSKYICKLTNHAIKETTKRSSLLYSR